MKHQPQTNHSEIKISSVSGITGQRICQYEGLRYCLILGIPWIFVPDYKQQMQYTTHMPSLCFLLFLTSCRTETPTDEIAVTIIMFHYINLDELNIRCITVLIKGFAVRQRVD